jgi:catechol 2,3-dioxygenase-like lactoylglutathione lyase family enzyme
MAQKAVAKKRAAGKRAASQRAPVAKERAAPRAAGKAAKRAAPRTKGGAAAKRTPAARPAPAARRERPRKQPETLRLRSIAPTLTVDDVGKSLAWYTDVLGFVAGERWESEGALQGVLLRAGRCEFWLTQDDFKKGRDRRKGVGMRFYCETAQDIDELAARIRAAGGTLAHEPRDQSWGTRELAVTDPDGFQITIYRPVKPR